MNNDQIIEYLSNLVKFDTSINPSKGIFPSNNCSNFIIEQSSKFGFDNISQLDIMQITLILHYIPFY